MKDELKAKIEVLECIIEENADKVREYDITADRMDKQVEQLKRDAAATRGAVIALQTQSKGLAGKRDELKEQGSE